MCVKVGVNHCRDATAPEKNRAFGLVTWQIATPKAVALEETGRSQAEG